jgi:8-oxo-dGTP diphosphatase
MSPPRLAARAVLMHRNCLLVVNAYPGHQSSLWCAPGGGVERGASLHDNLKREVMEETGLTISVGLPCLVNEFHNPRDGFHQVEIFFRCKVESGTLSDAWQDPEQVVNRRRWVTRSELAEMRIKPDRLIEIAWTDGFDYDPLEVIVR